MGHNRDTKKFVIIILLSILLVQGLLVVAYGGKKTAYHVDEIYTFELANCPDTWISSQDGFMESWVDGTQIQKAITVDGLGDLDYATVYRNQKNDVHPPLYYAIIHTVSALFSGAWSKWIGILPNLLFSLLTTVLVYLAGVRLFGRKGPALVAAGWWAWSVGSMSMAVFLRMYAMLTFECMALVLLHLVAVDEVRQGILRKRTLVGLFLVTLSGILTQYYFLVFCFFLCGIFSLYLCATKRWKLLMQYVVAEVAALCGAIILFPKMLYHIFGGYRGQQAFESAVEGAGFLEGLRTVGNIVNKQLCNGWLGVIVLLAVLAFVAGTILRRSRNGERPGLESGDGIAVYLACVAGGYWGMITKVAPYQTDRYVFCVYPLVVLCLVYLCHRGLNVLAGNKRGFCTAGLAALGMVVILASHWNQTVNYLYTNYQQRYQALEPYKDYPIVYLSVYGTYTNRMDVYIPEFVQAPQVFCCENGNFDAIAKAANTKDIQNGFLLYIQDQGSLTQEDIRTKLAQRVEIDHFESVTAVGGLVYYCTLEEAAR